MPDKIQKSDVARYLVIRIVETDVPNNELPTPPVDFLSMKNWQADDPSAWSALNDTMLTILENMDVDHKKAGRDMRAARIRTVKKTLAGLPVGDLRTLFEKMTRAVLSHVVVQNSDLQDTLEYIARRAMMDSMPMGMTEKEQKNYVGNVDFHVKKLADRVHQDLTDYPVLYDAE